MGSQAIPFCTHSFSISFISVIFLQFSLVLSAKIEKKLQKKDVKLAKLLCDSTYKIVAFMGRPALYRQGKQILSNFMTDRFDRQVRSYAGETFTKILKLEL